MITSVSTVGSGSASSQASSVVVGATATAAGTAGLVPAPTAGQQGFALFGSGAFRQIQGSDIGGTIEATQISGALSATQIPSLGLSAVAVSGSFTDLLNRPAAGISCALNGAGSVIPTGLAGFVYIPFACTITGWTLAANVSGSIAVDIWNCPLASWPSSAANTICGGSPPTLTSGVLAQGSSFAGWTTAIPANTMLAFNVNSATTVIMATLVLTVAH